MATLPALAPATIAPVLASAKRASPRASRTSTGPDWASRCARSNGGRADARSFARSQQNESTVCRAGLGSTGQRATA
eukprot:854405-Alexandrium_andersonii.AAC.1